MEVHNTINSKMQKQQAKETLDILERGYIITRRIHPGYQDYENAKTTENSLLKKYKIKQDFGKWQYNFKKGSIIISLIKFRTNNTPWLWEMHNEDEDEKLFNGCKRFRTNKAALQEIENLLGE